MKRLFNILFISLIGLSFLIFILSNSNKKIESKTIYTLKKDICVINDETKFYNFTLYTKDDNPSLKYIPYNNYYLTDYNEENMYPLNVINLNITKEENYYIYEFLCDMPQISNVYIEELYIKILNDKYLYKGQIGSLSVIEYSNIYISPIKTYINENNLIVELDKEITTISNLFINNNIKINYIIENNKIILDIDSKNLINNISFVIETDICNIKIKNINIEKEITIDNLELLKRSNHDRI